MKEFMQDADSLNDRRETTRKALWRAPEEGESKFYVDAPFVRQLVTDDMKAEDGAPDPHQPGDIKTRGYASTWVKDRDEEYVHPSAFDETLDPFFAKNPLMLWQHDMDWPLGKYTSGELDPYGLITEGLIPKVHDREPDWKHLAYHSVERGIVKTHSIGGFMRRKYDAAADKLWINRVDLMEISIVSIPANPESIFEAAVKSLKAGTARPTITQSHIDQMMQILGTQPMTNPELLAMSEKMRIARYEDLAAHYHRCGKTAPEYEEWNELAKDVFSSKGLEAVRGGGTRVVAFLRKVQGHVAPTGEVEIVDVAKSGRTISAANESSLRKAVELVEGVLSSIDGGSGEPEEQTGNIGPSMMGD